MLTERNPKKIFLPKQCEYFPCHPTQDPESFNCLFCFCPLYALGKACGGNYQYLYNGRKDCSACTIPHQKDRYDDIIGKYPELEKMMKESEQP